MNYHAWEHIPTYACSKCHRPIIGVGVAPSGNTRWRHEMQYLKTLKEPEQCEGFHPEAVAC